MPKKESVPPSLRGISASDFKNRKRLIKILADRRVSYGKSVLCDNKNRQWLYPLDIAAKALFRAEIQAIKLGRSLDLSDLESELIGRIYRPPRRA